MKPGSRILTHFQFSIREKDASLYLCRLQSYQLLSVRGSYQLQLKDRRPNPTQVAQSHPVIPPLYFVISQSTRFAIFPYFCTAKDRLPKPALLANRLFNCSLFMFKFRYFIYIFQLGLFFFFAKATILSYTLHELQIQIVNILEAYYIIQNHPYYSHSFISYSYTFTHIYLFTQGKTSFAMHISISPDR